MSSKTRTIAYGIAALAVAAVLVAAYTYIPAFMSQTQASSTYVVMLTDPPSVPSGTLWLNLTYSGVSLHVTTPGKGSQWVDVPAPGTVNLLGLYSQNESQVIASSKIPVGSLVDQVRLDVVSVQIDVNNTVSSVASVTNQISISINNPQAAGAGISGSLLNMMPSIAQISGVNASGGAANYFVMVPSATAIAKGNVSQSEAGMGQRMKLSAQDHSELQQAEAAGNVTVVGSSLAVNGNTTALTVTLKNDGKTNATVFGLVLHGNLSASLYLPSGLCPVNATSHNQTTNGRPANQTGCVNARQIEHPDTLAFRIDTTSNTLVPLFGDQSFNGTSMLLVQPGQTVTLSFSGTIQLSPKAAPVIVITPVSGQSYTLRLMGEGFETSTVTAT